MTTIVCIGDSIVEGEGDEKGLSGWAGRLQQTVLKDSSIGKNRVYNLGMGMETSIDLLHRLYTEVLYREPDVIILQGSHGDSRSGLNNAGEEEFEIGKKARMRSYRRMLDYLSKSGKKILVLGLNPVVTETSAEQRTKHIESTNKGIAGLCKDYGLPFLDPRAIFEGEKLTDLYADGIHPNARGYEKMFDRIYERLISLKYL